VYFLHLRVIKRGHERVRSTGVGTPSADSCAAHPFTVASFSHARGLVSLLSFPCAASFPALKDSSARDRGSGIFRARRLRRPPPRCLERLRTPNRRLRAAWNRLELRLAPKPGEQASTSA